MKTRDILSRFDWLNVIGSSSQHETMHDLVNGVCTLKVAINDTYIRKNKMLLKKLTPHQMPYFLEATRKILNFYSKQRNSFKFDEESFLKKVNSIVKKPLAS